MLIAVLVVLFCITYFVMPGLNSSSNGTNRLVVTETPKNNLTPGNILPFASDNGASDGIIPSDIPNNTANNTNKTPVPPVLSEKDKKFLATLQKEDLPRGVENLPFKHLDVPFFKQQYIRSCEEASLRMVLAFYDIATDDMTIAQKVGYDPHPWDLKNNIWDDPNKMFVGNIDDPNQNGYGAFAPAIASAARAYGRDAESYVSVSAVFLAENIYSGYPVIVWGFYDVPPFTKYSWTTPEGNKIVAYKGEHARVVVGVFGNASKPVGFLLDDPLTGEKEEYWSSERLMAHINEFGNLTNQAVVVK